MRLTLDFIVSAALLGIAAVLLAFTFTDQFDVPTFGGDIGPAVAPRAYLIIWMLLAAVALAQAIRAKPKALIDIDLLKLGCAIGISAVTAIAMTVVGFVFATIPGFYLFCWTFGYRRYLVLGTISVLGPVLIWALFTFVFEILLPASPWFHLI